MPTMTLTEQLAAADAAAAPLTAHVAELESELRTAIDTRDFGRAQQVQAKLASARDHATVAAAAVQALRQGAEAIGRAHAEDQQRLAEAQQRAKAADDLADAMTAERNGLIDLDAAMARMLDHLRGAKRELLAALALEHRVGQARQAQWTAREHAGEIPPGTAPRAASPNKASVAAERDPLISQLARSSP